MHMHMLRCRRTFRVSAFGRCYWSDVPPRPMALGRSNESAPRLASRVTAAHFQPKLDGWRVIADVQTGRMYTRSGAELPSTRGLEHIRDALLSKESSNRFRYVDGELMHDGGRERIQGSINSNSTGDGLSLHLFDCVLEAECFSRRHEALQEWLTRAAEVPALQLVRTRQGGVGSVADALVTLQEVGLGFQKDGFEGAVLRLDDALADGGGYTIAGGRSRTPNALKWKVREDDEFEIRFLNEQAPKGSGMLGSVRCSRNGAGSNKYFTALVDVKWSEERRKQAWEQRALYSVKHVDEEERDGFEPQWKAVVEHNGMDKTGKPVAGTLVGFRHRDDLPPVRAPRGLLGCPE